MSGSKIIHIDIDPASISKIIDVDIPIVGDVKAILSAMNKALESLWSFEVGGKNPSEEALISGGVR